MTDAKTVELLLAVEDLHETVKRKPDPGWPEFRSRLLPMLERYEHGLRAAGTMDKATFVGAFSWFFQMAQPGAMLEMVSPSDTVCRLRMRVIELPMGHRGVSFEPHRADPRVGVRAPDEAAAVVWRFLQGENPPEARR